MDPDKILYVHVVSQPNPDNFGRELRNGAAIALVGGVIGTFFAVFQERLMIKMRMKEQEAMYEQAHNLVHGSSVPKPN